MALAIRGLEKRYDDGTRALEALDLEILRAPSSAFWVPTAPARLP